MADPLTFLMGTFAATLPADLLYCKNHMWCRPGPGGVCRFGFTGYAVRLMQDVYFLEWKVDAGSNIRLRQEVGFVESSKAQSELYAPLAGVLTAFNPEVLNDPSAVNADAYGAGWLFEMTADPADCLDAAGYCLFLESHWEQTQRLIKKQIHQEGD